MVIFDCDGVLVDSEPIVLGVLGEQMRQLGVGITDAECGRDFTGLTQDVTAARIADRLGAPIPAGWFDELTRAVDAALRIQVRPVPGVQSVLARLDVPFCVASNGRPEKVALTLAVTGLAGYFEDRIFTSHQVSRGKPAPDLFLFAAASMGAKPERCVVVEDSEPGVAAARAAGMRVLQFEQERRVGPPSAGSFSSMTELPALLGL
ncbi:HAD family hydrolase [Actinoplanes sp. CA-015351]|uniref:HAD family hydrolase n=1 Tax=Actinoplanes sp. CA-015351 TaxID=3239897 RepID=UPI003D97455E